MMTGLAYGEKVIRVPLYLGDLLKALTNTRKGGWASALDITLTLTPPILEGKMVHGGGLSSEGSGLACRSGSYFLYCNGICCAETNDISRGYKSYMVPTTPSDESRSDRFYDCPDTLDDASDDEIRASEGGSGYEAEDEHSDSSVSSSSP